MIKDNIKLDLLKDGYCILKNVLNEKEILDLEKALDQGLESKNIQKCNILQKFLALYSQHLIISINL